VERISVHVSLDAGNAARVGILPDYPGTFPKAKLRLSGDAAKPELIPCQLTLKHITVEDYVCVDTGCFPVCFSISDSITEISSSAFPGSTHFLQVGEPVFHSRSRTGGSCEGSCGTT
jgi:hypothetical protein